MTTFLTKRNILIASVAGTLLIGGITFKAFADDHRGFGGRSLTLETMLDKTGAHFDEMDTDGDGVVTTAEAEAAKSEKQEMVRERMNERLTYLFARIDSDQDGFISEGDRGYNRLSDRLNLEGDLTLEQVLTASAQRITERMANHGLKAGENAPTYPLTRETALAEVEARFLKADTDGNGALSKSEMSDHGFGGKHGCGPGDRHGGGYHDDDYRGGDYHGDKSFGND